MKDSTFKKLLQALEDKLSYLQQESQSRYIVHALAYDVKQRTYADNYPK